MSKRFLISEEDRKSILSLYAKKGIILEQDRTSGIVEEGRRIYGLTPYYLSVNGTNIAIANPNETKTEFFDSEYTASGDLNNLKFNLFNMLFESPNMWAINGESTSITKDTTQGYIISQILSNSVDFQVANELGYVVALNEDKIPQIFAVTIKIVPMANGNNPGQGVLSETEVIGINGVYTPKNRRDFENLYGILRKYSYRTDPVMGTKKVSNQDYSSMRFKDFRGNYAVGISLKKGPQGDGIIITQKDRFIPREVGGSKGDPFVFNRTTLSGNGDELLNEFISQFTELKQKDSDLYNTYVDFLKQKLSSIEVLAYSSIDEDPEQTIDYVVGVNAVEGCGGTMKRKDYNQCLSQKRAEKIAGILNQQLPDFPDFIGKGMGETDKFAPGKKWPNASREETLRNRRFDVVLPNYGDTVPED
jgi:hypothetical protein